MFRLLFVLTLLLPTWGLAQSGTLTLTLVGQTTPDLRLLGTADCDANIRVTWQAGTNIQPCTNLQIWVTDSTSCADTPAATDLLIGDISPASVIAQGTSEVDFLVLNLPLFGSATGVTCNSSQLEKNLLICGSYRLPNFGFDCTSSSQFTIKPATPPKLTFDSQPPVAPTLNSVTSLDSALSVNYTAGADTAVITLTAIEQSTGKQVASVQASPQSSTARISNLLNNVAYDVSAFATDQVGNVSGPSQTLSGTPKATDGFWAVYLDSGGTDRGGCSATGDGLSFGLGVWVLARLTARRRRT